MNILHVFRAPVGGLFRHVRDLVRGQAELGHKVGLICDSATGGIAAEKLLQSALPYCELGIHRIGMARLPGFGDAAATQSTYALAQDLRADVLHGHGAKGGLYARLAAVRGHASSFYTPHGGSLHYSWASPAGAAYLATEALLARLGTGVLFVCEFERAAFARKIGLAGKPHAVVHNGLWPEEFEPFPADADASDIVFMGDMRRIKGVDILLEALAIAVRQRQVTACLVGDGPDMPAFMTLAKSLGLSGQVSFPGRLSTQAALRRGRLLVMPSRAESFPYVVLEAAAAEKPIIASAVGGIPEILPEAMLSPPEQPRALARRIALALATADAAKADARALALSVAERFQAAHMARRITEFYEQSSDVAPR
jgi:glycosyltransferase involved in cell wall biosynthesis